MCIFSEHFEAEIQWRWNFLRDEKVPESHLPTTMGQFPGGFSYNHPRLLCFHWLWTQDDVVGNMACIPTKFMDKILYQVVGVDRLGSVLTLIFGLLLRLTDLFSAMQLYHQGSLVKSAAAPEIWIQSVGMTVNLGNIQGAISGVCDSDSDWNLGFLSKKTLKLSVFH